MLEKDYYTPSQAARILQVSRRRVTQMLNNGQLRGEQLNNGRWRIPTAAVATLLRDRSKQLALQRGSSVDETLEDLRDRIHSLERRMEHQADALNRTLNHAERVQEELMVRIRELEKKLNGDRSSFRLDQRD